MLKLAFALWFGFILSGCAGESEPPECDPCDASSCAVGQCILLDDVPRCADLLEALESSRECNLCLSCDGSSPATHCCWSE